MEYKLEVSRFLEEFNTDVDFGLKTDQYTVDEDDNKNMSAPALAITLSMFGTVLCSIAFIWQKKAHNLAQPG